METPPVISGKKKTLATSLTKSTRPTTPCRRPGLSRPSSSGLNKSCHRNFVGTPINILQETVVVNELNSSEPPSSSVDSTPKRNCIGRNKAPLNWNNENKHSVVHKVRRCLTAPSKTRVKVGGGTKDVIESAPVDDDSQTCKKIKLSLGRINSVKEIGQYSDWDCRSSSFVHKVDNSVSPTGTVVEVDDSDKNFSSLVHKVDSDVVPTEMDDLGEEVTLEIIEKLVKAIQEKKKRLEQLKVQETYAKKHNLEELRAQTARWTTAGREALEYSI